MTDGHDAGGRETGPREAGSDPGKANRWDGDAYDDAVSFVYEYGEGVVDLLDPSPGERILDVGCGTGHLTDRIGRESGRVVGVDRSREMVETARATYPGRDFLRADVRRLPFESAFDAVFSNAVLHWVDGSDQDAALSSVADALVPGGRFVAELGGAGNVGSIVSAMETELGRRGYESDHPWYFPTVGEYAARLEAHGFEVRQASLFDRPTELEGGEEGLATWLETFADGWLRALSPEERADAIAAVEDALRADRYRDGTWTADYRRLRFRAIKRDGEGGGRGADTA